MLWNFLEPKIRRLLIVIMVFFLGIALPLMASNHREERFEIFQEQQGYSSVNDYSQSFEQYHDYLKRHILNGEADSEPQQRKILRFLIDGIAIAGGVTSGIPFIQVACDTGNYIGGFPMCFLLSASDVISYGATSTWAALNLASMFHFQKNKDLRDYQDSQQSSFLKRSACNVFSVLSSVPTACSVYMYNDNKLLVIPAFLLRYAFNVVGYNYFFESIENLCRRQKYQIGGKNLNTHLIRYIDYEIVSSVLSYEGDDFNQLRQEVYNKLNIYNFIPNKDQSIPKIESADAWGKGVPKKCSQTLGLIFALGNSCVNGIIAYRLLSFFSSNQDFLGLGVTAIILPWFALTLRTNLKSSGDIFDIIYNSARNIEEKNYFQAQYPILFRTIPISFFVFSFFSGFIDARIAYDNCVAVKSDLCESVLPTNAVCTTTIFQFLLGYNILSSALERLTLNTYYKKDQREILSDLNDLKRALSVDLFTLPGKLDNTFS